VTSPLAGEVTSFHVGKFHWHLVSNTGPQPDVLPLIGRVSRHLKKIRNRKGKTKNWCSNDLGCHLAVASGRLTIFRPSLNFSEKYTVHVHRSVQKI